MFRSIRRRLVLSYVLLALLAVSVVGLLAVSLVYSAARARELEDLTANAEAVARQAADLLWPVIQVTELTRLTQTAAFLGDMRVRILDESGQALVDSGIPSTASSLIWIVPPAGNQLDDYRGNGMPMMMMPGMKMPAGDEWQALISENFPPGTVLRIVERRYGLWGSRFTIEAVQVEKGLLEISPELSDAKSRSERVVTVPVGSSTAPLGFVELSAGPDVWGELVGTILRALLLAGGGAAALAVILGLVISQRLTSPLRSLTDTAGRMGAGELSVRAQVEQQDEIGELAGQFNQMAQELEASFTQLQAERDALRRFIADASHELRTPVTALKNFVALLQGPAAGDPQAQREFLAESALQIERLEWITQNLLDLSRIDAGLVELELGEHSAAELVEAAAALFRSAAEAKEIHFIVSPVEEGLSLRCDRNRLEIALSNLLDNAIKFTPAGGQVELGAGVHGGGIEFWVKDSGPGIDTEDLPHIFERFYRGHSHSAGGSGLGLAIVKSAVEAQGGQVWVESQAGAGAHFRVRFGVTPDSA